MRTSALTAALLISSRAAAIADSSAIAESEVLNLKRSHQKRAVHRSSLLLACSNAGMFNRRNTNRGRGVASKHQSTSMKLEAETSNISRDLPKSEVPFKLWTYYPALKTLKRHVKRSGQATLPQDPAALAATTYVLFLCK